MENKTIGSLIGAAVGSLPQLEYQEEGVVENMSNQLNIIPGGFSFPGADSVGTVQYLVVHHTGGNAGDDYSAAQIHQMHQNRGWAGIGYHYVIRKNGQVEQGRPEYLKGSHTYGYNGVSLGVHVGGNFEEEEPTRAQIESLILLMTAKCREYGLPATAIKGHRDLDANLCPGESLYRSLAEVIRRVGEELANG